MSEDQAQDQYQDPSGNRISPDELLAMNIYSPADNKAEWWAAGSGPPCSGKIF